MADDAFTRYLRQLMARRTTALNVQRIKELGKVEPVHAVGVLADYQDDVRALALLEGIKSASNDDEYFERPARAILDGFFLAGGGTQETRFERVATDAGLPPNQPKNDLNAVLRRFADYLHSDVGRDRISRAMRQRS